MSRLPSFDVPGLMPPKLGRPPELVFRFPKFMAKDLNSSCCCRFVSVSGRSAGCTGGASSTGFSAFGLAFLLGRQERVLASLLDCLDMLSPSLFESGPDDPAEGPLEELEEPDFRIMRFQWSLMAISLGYGNVSSF